MGKKYCFVYCDYKFVYILYGYVDQEKNKIEFQNFTEDKTKVNKLDLKFKINIFIDEFIKDSETSFYTNAQYNSYLYKLLKDKLQSGNLSSVKNLNEEDLKSEYSNFIDLIIGDNISFSNEIIKRKFEHYLKDSQEYKIQKNLIPYLYFTKYISLINYDWSNSFATVTRKSYSIYDQTFGRYSLKNLYY